MDKRESTVPESTAASESIATPLPASASRLIRFYDRLDRLRKTPRVIGPLTTLLNFVYLGSLATIEARRLGWLPQPLAGMVSPSRFLAIGIAFYLLVLAEVVGLIFGLAESVARSIGKELEILSLILLRQSFEILAEFGEPIHSPRSQGRSCSRSRRNRAGPSRLRVHLRRAENHRNVARSRRLSIKSLPGRHA